MPDLNLPSSIPAEVYGKAKRSEWAQAAGICQDEMNRLVGENPFEKGNIAEFAGKCHFRSAFQVDNNEEFTRRMRLSESAYREAASFYEDAHQEALSRRTKARSVLSRSWSEQNSQQRKNTIEECLKLAREAETLFSGDKDEHGLAQTHLDILTYLREFFQFSTSREEIQQSFAEASTVGRNAIKKFESLSEQEGLLESLYLTLYMFALEAEPILTSSDFKELGPEMREVCKKLEMVSGEIGTAYAQSVARMMAGSLAFTLDGDPAKALVLLKDGMEAAESIQDSLTIGLLSWLVAHITLWSGTNREYTAERLAVLREAQMFGSKSIRNLNISMHPSFLGAAYANQANISINLAFAVTEAEEKRAHLQTAIQLASKGTERQDHTLAWSLAAHSLAKALYFLANSGLGSDAKNRLLKEAMAMRMEQGRITELLFPEFFWDKCVELNYLALVKAELSSSEQDQAKRIQLLADAVSDMKRCLEMGKPWEASGSFFSLNLAGYSEWYGDTLSRLCQLTGREEDAEKAAQAYQYAANCLILAKQGWPLGPLKWKMARIYDLIGNYKESSKQFNEAAEEYSQDAKRFSELTATFEELAKYMTAWSKVELGRLHRGQEEYELAAEKYDEASKVLGETRTWNYLSRFCTARSILEKGEALSQLEKKAPAIECFSVAAKTFRESKATLEGHLKQNSPSLEADEMRYWLAIAEEREEYCQGRVLVEEAELLDKKGEKSSSSRKYQSASEIFKSLAKQSQNSQARVELETLAKFCSAMGRMKEGESKASPELFSEAAELFMQVKESASGSRFRLLALADSYICRALEAGTKFRLSRDQLLYGEVKKHLETAGDYYQEAGFRKATDWTRATQRLFDSLFCLASAETEMDQRKKTEFYDLAEKHLESAAKLYGEAGFPGKKAEALGHLERAREVKDIIGSSIETLAEMPAASGAILTPLSLGSSQAVGLERFEDANVVGNITLSQREVSLGSDSEIELDMANVGRNTATLVKLENLVPQGFLVEKEKNPYHWENGTVDLRGKRLDYLKTFKVKIILKTAKAGTFELRPRVSFVDEGGNYKFYESWAGTVIVHEPQVAVRPFGLERVPPVVGVPSEFRFETERSRRIFEYLVKVFLDDYMAKRLYVEKAGWRSLMDLTRELKLPRSAVYASRGRSGPALSELERRGLVEVRIFPQERGRGGEIARVRVSYENAIIKNLIEQIVMRGQTNESSKP